MMYRVTGKFEVEYSAVVAAADATEAEERVTAAYRRLLEDSVKVEGRPHDVDVKPINQADSLLG